MIKHYYDRRSVDSAIWIPDVWDIVLLIAFFGVISSANYYVWAPLGRNAGFTPFSAVSCSLFTALIEIATIFLINFWQKKSNGILIYTICVLFISSIITYCYNCNFLERPYFDTGSIYLYSYSVGFCFGIVVPVALMFRARHFSKALKLRDYVRYNHINSGIVSLEYKGKSITCKMSTSEGYLSFYNSQNKRLVYSVAFDAIGFCQRFDRRIVITDNDNVMLCSVSIYSELDVGKIYSQIVSGMSNTRDNGFIPSVVEKRCAGFKGNNFELRTYLNQQVAAGIISEQQADMLFGKYRD